MRGGGSKRAAQERLQREKYLTAVAQRRAGHTCRALTGEIGAAGECLRCDAEQGEACRIIRPEGATQ